MEQMEVKKNIMSSTNSTNVSTSSIPLKIHKEQDIITIKELCKYWKIDNEIVDIAINYLNEIYQLYNSSKQHNFTNKNRSVWIICCIYIALFNVDCKSKDTDVTLTGLIENTENCGIIEFFLHLKHFVAHFQDKLSSKSIESLYKFINQVAKMHAIYIKYQQLFNKLLSPAITDKDMRLHLFGLGWLLFLNAKAQLQTINDLYDLTILLFAVMRFLLDTNYTGLSNKLNKNIKSSSLILSTTAISPIIKHNQTNNNNIQHDDLILMNLCNNEQVYNDVIHFKITQFDVFLKHLYESIYNEHDEELNNDTSLKNMIDYFAPNMILTSINKLRELYDSYIGSIANEDLWIDERIFLDKRKLPSIKHFTTLNGNTLTSSSSSSTTTTTTSITTATASIKPSTSQQISPNNSPLLNIPLSPAMYHPLQKNSVLKNSNATFSSLFSPIIRSPTHPSVPKTPFTKLMQGVTWLNTKISNLNIYTDPFLIQIFTILKQQMLLQTIYTHIKNQSNLINNISNDIKTSTNRKDLAIKLYNYYIRKLICSEIHRLYVKEYQQVHQTATTSNISQHNSSLKRIKSSNSFNNYPQYQLDDIISQLKQLSNHIHLIKWLQNLKFHNGLLACCYEIVFYVYKIHKNYKFPSLIYVFQLSCYDFIKVIESIIKQDYTLPKTIANRLKYLEYNCLSYYCWLKKDYILYNLLLTTKWKLWLSTAIYPFNQDISSFSQFDLSNDIAIYKSICLYFRKLHNYLSKCLLLLAESLSIDKIVIDLTWQLLIYILSHYTEQLVFNSHLHTIMLCSLYAIANKIANQHHLTFRLIIEDYLLKWEDNSAIVIKHVNSDQISIITYYNQKFIPICKNYINNSLKLQYMNLIQNNHHQVVQHNKPKQTSSVTNTTVASNTNSVIKPISSITQRYDDQQQQMIGKNIFLSSIDNNKLVIQSIKKKNELNTLTVKSKNIYYINNDTKLQVSSSKIRQRSIKRKRIRSRLIKRGLLRESY